MESSPINCHNSSQNQASHQNNAGMSLVDAKKMFMQGSEIAVISFFYNAKGELDGDGKSYTAANNSWDELLGYVMSCSDFTLRVMHVTDYSASTITH